MPSLNGFEFCIVSPHLWWEKFWLSPLKHARCPPTWDRGQWELLCDLFNFSSCVSQKDKGWNQRSLKTSRRKFMEKLRNSMYEENMEKSKRLRTASTFTSWRGCQSHQPMWKDSQCGKMFHRVLCSAKLWKRTFQIDSWTGSKKSVSKTMMTSFSCNKVLAETHESLRSTGCIGSSFDCKFHIFCFSS